MLLCTYQEVDNSKHWQLQMLVSMWSNHSLLVGMQNGSVTLEDSLRIRFLIKWNILYCHFTCHNNHTLLVIYLKELTAYVHTEAAHRCSSSVQLLSCVWLFMTQWTVAGQASLSITNSQSLPKLMSIKSVMPSNHLILCCPLLLPSILPSIRVFLNESVLCIRWPSVTVLASASVLLMNIQDWFPLDLTSWISLQSKGLSKVFSNTTFQKHSVLQYSAFFIVQLSHPYMTIAMEKR